MAIQRTYHFNGVNHIEAEQGGNPVFVEATNPVQGGGWMHISASQVHDIAVRLFLTSQDTAQMRNDLTKTVTHAEPVTAALSAQMPKHCVIIEDWPALTPLGKH
ncbi:hypothetical protein [Mesorhizobium helmanticense]|uniref:Uncharacterized protein n=1 Tax=Mesorhizobium helmanticense TaxID=1776423 RepID=A0A2T4IPT1_9HYPH|nr:hypothetical protein [Mesorhizobium helmanticense]PTE07672.1 hypothetical protein C9427_24810 [Mesorhizobium helmanticense]